MAEMRFYLDENLSVVIAEQLQGRGIDVVTARDLGALGDTDDNHLARAAHLGRVLCSQDTDFVAIAQSGVEHTGVIIGQPEKHNIGAWVKALTLYSAVYSAEDMVNKVEFL